MKKIIFLSLLTAGAFTAFSQDKLFTKTGQVSFYSKAPMEDIEAHNKAAISALDKKSGNIEFSLLMKGFEFEKALMQEHFNENYVESDKFPKAVFKGSISNIGAVNFAANGKYPVTVSGELTMHGITKPVSTTGTLVLQNNDVSANAEFNIALDDYKISIPGLMKDKISKTVKIIASLHYQPM